MSVPLAQSKSKRHLPPGKGKKMKTTGVTVFSALLLIFLCVNVQAQDIARLKTKKITLSGNRSKAKPQPWILVETEPRRVQPVGIKPADSRISKTSADVVDVGSAALNVGEVQVVTEEKRTYYIHYPALSLKGDARWLQLKATVVPRAFAFLKDMGAMKWDEVDRMPDLPVKRLTRGGTSLAIKNGETTVGPEEFLVRAVPGHVYAVEIQDDRLDYRVMFRIDSIDANGDCHIS